jgi:acyl-CoA synthetase (AMP-forming)/AMP-acid ligase II
MFDFETVHAAFRAAVARWPDHPFMQVLPETAAAYAIAPGELSYRDAAAQVDALTARYRAAGYRAGHRIGLLLENRPAYVLHWFALNALAASVVPINPDLRAAELTYLAGHSEIVLAVAIPSRHADLRAAGVPAVIGPDDPPPPAPPPATPVPDECALLYTSGTTGLPKGCVLSNTYFLECGRWYHRMGGLCALRSGEDRMLTPLPLFHMNAMAASAMAMLLAGGCLIVLDRFHPSTWWQAVAASRATIIHYLGVMPAILMAAPPSPAEHAHSVRFGFGAGIDRLLHAPAEQRFGFPLVEGWAMTETGAGATIQANLEPRLIGQSCFGRPDAHVQARVVLDDGAEAAPDQPGELLVRHAGPDPRHGFFSFYLKDPAATETGWEGGWWHTGDLVRRDASGNLFFVDRKKNVIRRSGENISALEVETVLQQHPLVRTAAVAAVPDPLRGDEVFACIIPKAPLPGQAAAAREITAWCLTRLAYYKAPGYIRFVDSVPLTSTNKLQRGAMKDLAQRLLADPACIDTRALKKRTP